MSTNFSPGSSPPHVAIRTYPDVRPGFAETSCQTYDRISAGLAYSRTLDLLRRTIGPRIDLEDIWTEHMLYEFVEKDVDKTMATMIDEPYVNHVPTCTGGVGYKNLYNFYKHHFIPQNPPSLKMKLVSRTVGADRIVDEMVLTFTHDRRIDWILPGIEPTGRRVEVALVSIVCVRGRKLYQEHIYWYVTFLDPLSPLASDISGLWFNQDDWWLLIRGAPGTKQRCWFKSDSWIRRACLSSVLRVRERCWIKSL